MCSSFAGNLPLCSVWRGSELEPSSFPPPTPHPRPPSPALSPAPESCHAGTLCRREPLSTKHQMCILLVVDVYGQPVAEPSVRLIFVASRSHCESNLLSDLVFEDLAFKYYRKASITKWLLRRLNQIEHSCKATYQCKLTSRPGLTQNVLTTKSQICWHSNVMGHQWCGTNWIKLNHNMSSGNNITQGCKKVFIFDYACTILLKWWCLIAPFELENQILFGPLTFWPAGLAVRRFLCFFGGWGTMTVSTECWSPKALVAGSSWPGNSWVTLSCQQTPVAGITHPERAT